MSPPLRTRLVPPTPYPLDPTDVIDRNIVAGEGWPEADTRVGDRQILIRAILSARGMWRVCESSW